MKITSASTLTLIAMGCLALAGSGCNKSPDLASKKASVDTVSQSSEGGASEGGESPDVLGDSPGGGASPESTDDENPTSETTTTSESDTGRETESVSDVEPSGDEPKDSEAERKGAYGSENAEKKEFSPLFMGWKEPELALFITGGQHGYIEPCGCTGLANQKGGLARRHALQKQLEEKGWKLVNIDIGDQVKRFGRQAEIKYQMTAAGLKTMGYHAIGFGADDLRLPAGDLYSLAAESEESKSPFVSANAALFDESFTPTYRVVTAGGKKVGITCVLGTEELKAVTNDEIVTRPAEEALAKVWSQLQQEECDLYVLMARAPTEETIDLAKKFPYFQVVVTSGGGGEPKMVPDQIPDTPSMLIQVGMKGMHVGVVGVFGEELKYQRVPLDNRFPDSRAMLQLLESYQDQLKTLGLKELGLTPRPHPSGAKFVGSEKCGECHTTAYDIWNKTTHSHATDSLVNPGERVDIPRHYDPECLSCHVTGWNPQKYFPYESGYLSLEGSVAMHGSGCENCHGPGSNHVASQQGDIDVDDETMLKYQLDMRLPLDKAELKCLECHDLDNSPDFNQPGGFEEYWEKVKHVGKD